jgi:predicted DsbA family dithiol-disulfide isomerase
VRIEIWSDVVCPWCYIGKRRLEQAIERLGHDVELVHRSFQLDPSSPRVPEESVVAHLGAKYGGGPEAGRQMVDRVEAVAAEEGLLFRLGEAQRVNTLDAHRLLHLALEDGPEVQGRLAEELLATYFLRAGNVADHDVLRSAAAAAGLEADRVETVLAGDAYADAVERDVREAAALGATGVPFVVVDRRYAVPGAQPAEVFAQVLERAWQDANPTLQAVGVPLGGDACGPEGCEA